MPSGWERCIIVSEFAENLSEVNDMKRSIRRAAAAFLAAALCLGGAMPVRALEYQGSESYMQGKYYEALQQVKLTQKHGLKGPYLI